MPRFDASSTSGIGVREAMIVVLLRSRLGSADALVVAAASRGILIAVELAAAAVGFLLLGRPRSHRTGHLPRPSRSSR
jgi:hypothetical protein